MPRYRGLTRVTVGPPRWPAAEAFVRGWVAGVRDLPPVVSARGEVERDEIHDLDARPTCRISFIFDAADAEQAEAFAQGEATTAGRARAFGSVTSDQHGWMGYTEVEHLEHQSFLQRLLAAVVGALTRRSRSDR
jgi:hypothetical protein